MMQGQGIGPVNAHIFMQPLFVTIELGTGRTGPVGHHGKERTFDSKVDFMVGELLGDHLVDTQSMPDGLKDVECPKGPGIDQAPLLCLLNNLLRGTALEDTAGELAQALSALGIISPPTIIDNADFGAFFAGIPHALGQLKMGDEGAIGSLLTGLTQIHVCNDRKTRLVLSSLSP